MFMIAPQRAQRGFTLVEVLITLVVFAFGILGVAGLQIVSLTSMDTAQYRSIASLKATEMADRMRANPGVLYSDITAAKGDCRQTYYDAVVATPNECAKGAIAADDLYDWSRELAARLPGGAGLVCRDSTPDDGTPTAPACDNAGFTLVVKVWWNEKARSKDPVEPKRIVIMMVNQ